MRDEIVGRGLRALRHRRDLTQRELSALAGVARSIVTDFEAGRLGGHSLDALREVADALGGWIRIDLVVPGGDLSRLLDADHAALQGHWKVWLERHGWSVDPELTFNHFGERGSIDLFAWHAGSRVLLVIEIKTVLVDVQDTLARIDRKARIAAILARHRDWKPAAVVPALLVAEGTTARRRVVDHAALFSKLALRGRAALRWMANPRAAPPSGILCMTKLPPARSDDRRRAGSQRVRRRKHHPRS